MKNTLKKALSIFLTVLMIVTTVPFAFAAEENEVTHQPSSGEPFVALKNSEGLTYQWYTVGYEEEEITDQNTSIADWGWTKSSYDSETGWIGADIVDHYGGNIFFVISLKANETVRVKLIGDFYDEISLFDEQTYNEKAKKYVEGVDTYDLTVKYDGNYTLYAYADCDVNEYINNRIIAHRITPVYTPVEGENSFTLNNPEFGKEYVCKISDSNGETVLITNKFEYCYAITNQPTIDNLSVGVNYTEGTTYQWYKVNGEIKEITDENAEGDWSEFDVPFAATVYENGKWFADEFEGMQYYFRIDLKAGEKINLELSEPVESVTFSCEYGSTESVVPENSKKVTYTAKEDGCYWVITEEVIDYITAYIGDPEYIVLEAQNDATLTPSVDGMYICKVVFADGTTEMSDIVDAVVSHICDFSGEWEITDEKHWKKCANENCYIISDEDKHVYTDGKCFCGYECPHESYYNAICQKCGIECLHENFSEVTNKGSDIFYIASTGGGNHDQQGDKLLDWDADTKWWCMFSEETQVSVTFGYPRKATIKSYILTVADDADRYPNFNWTAWTIYGTNDLQGEWTIVHSVSDAILPTEGESGAFEVNSESPYMYYKLVVDAVGDEGYMQQMADINIEVEYKNGRECDECGYICLHEGTLVSVPEKAATCTEAGWEAYKYCTACDYTTYKEIPVSDHDWSNKDGICANCCGETCPHSSYTDGVCDKCDYECPHEWNDGVLTRPVYDAVLGSKDGYYTYTCAACGEEKTETVKSADYSAYEAVSEEINALLQSDDLTSEAKQAIYSAANECGLPSNDLTESEQNIVDDLVAELEKIIADAEEKIASGEYVKIDGMKEYNKIADALDAELMENYSQEEIAALAEKAGDEINARFGEIIEKAEALTGTVAENKDALAEIESELSALYAEMKNCLDGVHNGLVYEVTEEAKCEVNAIESATCTLCGETDEREIEGTALEHEPNEQMCKGYWCSRCRSFYGEGNPDIHLDGYSSTGKIKDGQCDGCNKQLAFIKSGETYEINSYAYVVEFAPVVDGRYILTVDGPEGTEIDVREVVDGVNKGINCEVISDLVYVVDCTVGKTYIFEVSNYYGYNISSMTLECETHKGTVQTCYGYICDACGEYFGEVPGHDIVIDEAKAPTCTETGLTEGSHCSRCDDMTVAQEEIPALNHKDTLVKVDAKASTCTEAGHEAYEYCTACDYTTYKEIPASHDIIIDEAVAPKCGKTGLTAGQHCSRCDAMTIIQEIVPALTHKDSDGDYQCDYGCGHEFEKPVEPDQPDTPDEPTDDTCDHLCHKDGILGFFWKIVRFFIKLFKTNPVCECGAAHY